MKNIIDFINEINTTDESSWLRFNDKIVKDYEVLINLINSPNPPFIYGVNSMVGHMDQNHLNENDINSFQTELIYNHSLDMGFGYYDEWQIRCIFYSKLRNIIAGGTGISPNLYTQLVKIFCNQNYKIKIPKHSSYSCGDVVPGANFAIQIKQMMESNYDFKHKDAISMINGNFVSLGLSLSLLPNLLYILEQLCSNTIRVFESFDVDYNILYVDKNHSDFSLKIYNEIKNKSQYTNMVIQPSVSLRASLKTINLLRTSIIELYELLKELLDEQSDNPLINRDFKIRSNSSFFSPELSIKLSSIIETLLFISWSLDRRVHYLLSGKIPDTNINLSSNDNKLGLIQVPKLITNIIQKMRLRNGTRSFSIGMETSYGIEDLWTNNLEQVEQITNLMNDFETILKIENLIIDYKSDKDYDKFKSKLNSVSKHDKIDFNFKYII